MEQTGNNKMKFDNRILFNYFPVFLSILFLIGGLGIDSIWISWSGMLLSAFYLLVMITKGVKIVLPPRFYLFLSVILLFIPNLFLTHDVEKTLRFLFLCIGGVVLWVTVFNIPSKSNVKAHIFNVLIIISIFFGNYVLVELIRGVEGIKAFAIIGFSSTGQNHHHIGDFFAILGSVFLYKLTTSKAKLGWLFATITSFGFVIFSQSRSALLSLAVCGFLVVTNLKDIKIREYLKYSLVIFSVVSLFYFAQYKSLLFSRSYFIQGLIGLINNPLGVGMGSFDVISMDPNNQLFGFNSVSTLTHNLPLEFLTGMGIFGFVFVYFFVITASDALIRIKNNPVFSLIFLALSINFFFDFTYAIPMMFWLWFISLGLIQRGRGVS